MKNIRLAGSIFDSFFFGFIIVLFGFISFCPPFIMDQNSFLIRGCLLSVFALLAMSKGLMILRKSDLPLWIFLAALGINVFVARERSTALNTYINLAVPMLCIYYITAAGVTSTRKFDILVNVVCFFTVLIAVWGIMDFVLGWDPLYEYYLPNFFYERYKESGFLRAIASQCHPPVLGSYLIAGFPFLILFARSGKNRPRQIAGYVMAVLAVCAIILTFSRGVLVAFIGSMILLFLFFSRDKIKHTIFILITAFFLVTVSSFLPYPFSKYGMQGFVFFPDGVASSYRLGRLSMVWDMLASAPFTGIGFQHFRILFDVFNKTGVPVPFEFMVADNMYLTMLAETGIAGFCGFLVFMFFVLKRAAALKAVSNRAHFLIASLAALLINMAAYELFYWVNPYLYFCLLIGLVEAFRRNMPQTRT